MAFIWATAMTRNNKRNAILAVLLCVSLGSAVAARADFDITVGSLTLAPGGSGLLPVYINSNAMGGQDLAAAGFTLQITTSGPTQLDFQNSPAAASDPTFTNASPPYVFLGNSADLTFSTMMPPIPIPLGTASMTVVPNDTFIGGDATYDGTNVTVGATNDLLGYVPVTANTILPPVPGDTFTVSLVPTADGSPIAADGNTGFQNMAGNFFPYSSTSGTVTISSVPEPGSIVLLVIGLAAFAGGRRFRRICR